MASLVIRARYPLGYFLGHTGAAAQVATFPDTARLFSALVQAAAKGVTAHEVDGDLKPAENALGALQWIEANPPSALAMPSSVRANRTRTEAYRAEGVFESKSKPRDRKMRKPQSDGVAVGGAFGWIWQQGVPEEIARVIADLCADVSCLGEADSPVVLDTEPLDPTHAYDPHASAFAAGAKLAVRSPTAGRFDELEADYVVARPVKSPSASRDGFAWGAYPDSHKPSRDHVRDLVYRPLAETVERAPWRKVVVVPFAGDFVTRDRVPLCVAIHRALATGLGDAAPAFITGRYAPGAKQPPNRLAIQLLEAGHPGIEEPSIGLLIPPDVDDMDLAALARAIGSLRRVWVSRSKAAIELRHDKVTERDAATFWGALAPGQLRFWVPAGALVPEVRRQKSGNWTLADAATLSAAFVCRESLDAPRGPGERRYARLVASARDRGVLVHNAKLINDSDAARYAHKMPEGVPVTPYQAWMEMGDLVPSRALFALGQSRHLGGGLMLPIDLNVATAAAMGLRS